MFADFAAVIEAANLLFVWPCPAVAAAPPPSVSTEEAAVQMTWITGYAVWLFPGRSSTCETLPGVVIHDGLMTIVCLLDRVNTTTVLLYDEFAHDSE